MSPNCGTNKHICGLLLVRDQILKLFTSQRLRRRESFCRIEIRVGYKTP